MDFQELYQQARTFCKTPQGTAALAFTVGLTIYIGSKRLFRGKDKKSAPVPASQGQPAKQDKPQTWADPPKGEYSVEQLKEYDGTDPKKAVLVGVMGDVLDVSKSDNYRPGGGYAMFAGKDVSRALAKMSFEEEDLNGNMEGLTLVQRDTLNDWHMKLSSRYPIIGTVKN